MTDEPGTPAAEPDAPTPQEDRLAELVAAVERLASRPQPAADESDDRLTRVESAVKWASPWRQLVGFAAFLIVGGISVFSAMGSYAKTAVVETVREAHKAQEAPVEPSVATVDAVKDDVGSVKEGVENLLKEDERRKDVKAIEVELELHTEQYQEKMQDYAAKKARDREPDKPGKSDRHIRLEADRKDTLTKKY